MFETTRTSQASQAVLGLGVVSSDRVYGLLVPPNLSYGSSISLLWLIAIWRDSGW